MVMVSVSETAPWAPTMARIASSSPGKVSPRTYDGGGDGVLSGVGSVAGAIVLLTKRAVSAATRAAHVVVCLDTSSAAQRAILILASESVMPLALMVAIVMLRTPEAARSPTRSVATRRSAIFPVVS